ncbi:MAG: MgtC/SapB family protein [Firmicutes bacterium]|nr:MgtC/SapB family protein [Bacillota bacterium]
MSYWDILLRFGAAVLTGGAIGYERQAGHHPAGLRTHILVCIGSAMVALIECLLTGQVPAGNANVSMTLGRMSAQVISGIGFLGAGTIITTKRNIAGLTTAASLWAVACIGIAAGMGLYGLCMIGAGFTLVVLALIKRTIVGHVHKIVEVSFRHRKETLAFLNEYLAAQNIRVYSVDFRVEESTDGDNLYTNVYMLDLPRRVDVTAVILDIAEYVDVQKVRTRDP